MTASVVTFRKADGRTSCCGAFTTFVEDVECCRACFTEVGNAEPGTVVSLANAQVVTVEARPPKDIRKLAPVHRYRDHVQRLTTLRAEAAAAEPGTADTLDAYVLGRITKDVRTKMGLAAKKGEYVIFCEDEVYGGKRCRTFWSRRNQIRTLVTADYVEEVRVS